MFELDDCMGGGLDGIGGGGFGGYRGRGREPPKPKVPVTILCGFLGAGKTTLVRHILRNREGLKVGVVVNDVAEANIDSEVLAFEDADGIVGLQNGCACCSGRDDLFARLQDLVDSEGMSKIGHPWDRLVVECSGVAEPESIAAELEAMTNRGEAVMKRIFLAGIVCVVDASTFWDAYNEATAQASAASGSRPEVTSEETERKPLSALLVNQLESSDTVIINKTDLVESAALERLTSLLKVLCPTARHFTSTKGALPLRTLLPAEPIGIDMPAYVPTLANRHGVAVTHAKVAAPVPTATKASDHIENGGDGHAHAHDDAHGHAHGHGHSHGHGHGHGHAHGDHVDCDACNRRPPAHERYGLTSFVYRRKEMFNMASLAAVARQLPIAAADLDMPGVNGAELTPTAAFQGVVRSKGFIRVVGGEKPYYWSHAGRQLQISASSSSLKSKLQELVFIGIDMDESGIVRALDACLEQPETDADGAKL